MLDKPNETEKWVWFHFFRVPGSYLKERRDRREKSGALCAWPSREQDPGGLASWACALLPLEARPVAALSHLLLLDSHWWLVSLVPGTASLGMQYHKLTEHFDEKPFSCEECGAKFAANSTLKNHLRLHTGDRPFMCKHCLMTFTQASALAYHTKKKHSEGRAWRISSLFLRRLPMWAA